MVNYYIVYEEFSSLRFGAVLPRFIFDFFFLGGGEVVVS